MFEAIDAAISVALNAGVGSSPGFDSLVFQVSQNHLLKCAPPVTAVWFLWWTRQQAADRDRRQAALLMVLAACFLTMGIVRALTRLLPFRLRPIFETELHLVKAAGMWLGNFDRASSMPSDHAGLFFALAALQRPQVDVCIEPFSASSHAGMPDAKMLKWHQDVGCEVLVARQGEQLSGYVFRRFRIRSGR